MHVVWQDARDGPWQIYWRDLQAGAATAVDPTTSDQMGPAIDLTVTMALDPHLPVTRPLVVGREVRFAQDVGRERQEGEEEIFFAVRGTLVSKEPLEKARVILVEQGVEALPRPDGEFLLGRLRRGEYTLEVSAEGFDPTRHQITVPDSNYDIEVK